MLTIIILTVILTPIVGSTAVSSVEEVVSSSSHVKKSYEEGCFRTGEIWWSSLFDNELPALEAIKALHRQLDDDMNGNVDLSESDEFLREELQYEQGYQQNRQDNFHRNNDDQVSVKELWTMWISSPVHNWTVGQTAEWVATVVQLPEYRDTFIRLKINGTYLPSLAVNYRNFVTAHLGIKDVIARQKLLLKAQDVVLFGPPKDTSSYTKDVVFIVLLLAASSMSYWVYTRNVKMSHDMKALMKSEELLRELQNQMDRAKWDQEMQTRNKEGFLNDIILPVHTEEISKLEDEVKHLRTKLHRAEVELQLKRWIPPPELNYWLQVTYNRETKEHKRKQATAEKLLEKACKACNKLKKKRSSFINAFIPLHSRCVDDVDAAVLNAKSALIEITDEQRERMNRWNQIEILLNPDIEIQTDSRSVSILSTEQCKAEEWSHSTSLTKATVQFIQSSDASTSTHHNDASDSCTKSCCATSSNAVGSSRSGSARKYPSWQKVKRLLSFDERQRGIPKDDPSDEEGELKVRNSPKNLNLPLC